MKHILVLALLTSLALVIATVRSDAHTPAAGQDEPAPPAGMARYYLAILRAGDGGSLGADPSKGILKEHLAHLDRMFRAGKLVGSGPVLKDANIRGIAIFRAASQDEVSTMMAEDPAVRAGMLKVAVHPWWGPDGIGDAYKANLEANPKAEDRMQTYYLGFLTRGASWTPEQTPATAEIQKNHLAHIGKMAEAGHLVAAGPFLDGGNLRGIFVFRTETIDEARSLAEADPAVKAGRLALDIVPWMVAEGVLPGSWESTAR